MVLIKGRVRAGDGCVCVAESSRSGRECVVFFTLGLEQMRCGVGLYEDCRRVFSALINSVSRP